MAGCPGISVWLLNTYADALSGVMVSSPMVNGGNEGSVGESLIVLLPTAIWLAPAAKLIGVPDIVIAGPPGSRV